MYKMIFIEPKSANLHIFSKFALPRLGSFILGTLMKKRGWEVEIIVEELQDIDYEDIKTADLIGISTITSTAPRAYAIADRVREMGIPVIMGGPHVTWLTDEALEHADYVIRGEGEHALMEFAEAFESDGNFSGVSNLSYQRDGKYVHNMLQPYINDLDKLPFPDLSLMKDYDHRVAGQRIIPIQTSRGCPFDCSFCSVTGMFGKKYRFRSTDNIMAELRQYNDSKNFIFFYDDNFAANPKRTKELLRAMINEKFKFKWSTQVRVDVAKDPELIRLMKKAGCHTLFVGLESVNQQSLDAMKKHQTVEDTRSAIKILRKHNIHVHGMFVYGFDQDDWKTVKKTVRFARKSKLSSSQFLILTPLPGSELFNKMNSEKRIQFFDWSLYDTHHVVFKPLKFTQKALQKAQMISHRKFYSVWESFKKFLRGDLLEIGIARYARHLNRNWRKNNKMFLKITDLMSQESGMDITIEVKQKIKLDDKRRAG